MIRKARSHLLDRAGIPADRFTKRARHALDLALHEARRYRDPFVGTEFVLLGLIEEGEGIAARALADLGVEPPMVRSAVDQRVNRSAGTEGDGGEAGLTRRAQGVVELAMDEAKRLGHNYIGTEHLLLGLLLEGEGGGGAVLNSLGVTLDLARGAVRDLLQGGGEAKMPKDSVITCRITREDLDAIDALVEAGIRGTRSDAASWLIHAGIAGNQELIDRVYGTVAEIRRLREVARTLARDDVPSRAG